MGYVFNGTTKVITLTPGTTSVSVRDLWSRWVDWWVTSDNSRFLEAFGTLGGDDIDPSAGTTVPIYAFLLNGWRVKPQESNHTLNIIDGILLVDGGGDPFVNTNGSFVVRINFQQPVQAISFASGGGGSPTASQVSDAVWAATAAANNVVGSMGEKLNDAGSGTNLWTESIETGMTAKEALRLIAAVLVGKVSGAAGTTITIRSAVADDKNRVVATVDVDGNRLNVVTDLT